ncbi:MAG: hypothetical protein M1835_002813, partial [Candelina submexicana]
MTSYFSHLNPVPAFPAYRGPYKVGSIELEVPTSDLKSPAPAPDPSISTVHFRLFYPCESTLKQHERPVRWIPHPQRETLGAYARFLGANSIFAELISYFPRLLYYITIPVLRNAPLLQAPTKTKRWPVMIFSHGLGGSRNAYSHLLGSLSSYGIVVVAPDHRDGSSPLQHIRETSTSKAKTVGYRSYPHKPSKDVEDGRNEQLSIRLWELALVHEALLKIDLEGDAVSNLDPNDEGHYTHIQSKNNLHAMFKDQLNVHHPSSISWAGHSFGASTIVQFVKSVFWQSQPTQVPSADHQSLFRPSPDSAIVQQITPYSPVALLDLWCLPLQGDSTHWLWNKPMPSYFPSGPGGGNLLAILSEAFFKWRGNVLDTKRVLSENPSSDVPEHSKAPPHFFYPIASAHLSQSDFGVLFPWITKKVFKAENPERTLLLNVRAILQ